MLDPFLYSNKRIDPSVCPSTEADSLPIIPLLPPYVGPHDLLVEVGAGRTIVQISLADLAQADIVSCRTLISYLFPSTVRERSRKRLSTDLGTALACPGAFRSTTRSHSVSCSQSR